MINGYYLDMKLNRRTIFRSVAVQQGRYSVAWSEWSGGYVKESNQKSRDQRMRYAQLLSCV